MRIYSNFQKLVYIVMYAIRNKHKMEKIQRAQYYHNLHNKSEKKEKEKNYNGEPKEDVTPKANEEPYSQNNLSKNNLDRQSSNLNPINDNMPLLNQNEEMMKPAPNFNEVNKNESYEERAKNDDLPPNESNNFKSSGLENEDKKDIPAPMNLNNEDDEPEEEEVTLKCPEGFFNKIIYLFEFPILVCLFVLPNYKKNPSVKKLAFSLLLNLTLMGILLFFITRWLHVVSIGVNMNEQTMGFVFCSLGLSFPFIKYNFKIAASDKDVDFMQCFLQLGVYKIGVCIGLSWLFYCIVYLSNEINVVGDLFRFGVLEAVHGGILIFLLLVTLIKKFKYTSRISGIYLLCFVGFTIAGIILLQT